MTLPATTVWLLILTAPGGLTSFQGWFWSRSACEAARETYTHSEYYQAVCVPKEIQR